MAVDKTRTDWLVGAASCCDLVIDQPGVSSRHCQITQTSSQLMLSDLNSTNGTWVNGNRITTAAAVGPGDEVSLGTQTRLTWGQIQQLAGCRVVRIGRAADNDIVVDDEKVSGSHARLLIDGDHLTLIDLESSNGTFVGDSDERVSRASVSMNDEVRFASTPRRVDELLASTIRIDRPTVAPKGRYAWRGVGLAVIVLVVAAVLLSQPWDRKGPPAATADPKPSESDPLAPERSAEQKLEEFLFAVVVRSEENEPGLRVGTAWAVSDRRLATSGNLVIFLQQSKAGFPIVSVRRPSDGSEYAVTGTTVHPVCKEKAKRMEKVGGQIDDARRRLESMDGGTRQSGENSDIEDADSASIEALAEKIVALEDQWFVAAEDMIHFDVGLLETESSLLTDVGPTMLPLAAEPPSRLAPVTVAGAAFPHEQSILVESSPLPLVQLSCTVESFARYSGDGVARMILRCPAGHEQQNWLGSPTLNSLGEIIGLYSRPTPSANPDTPPDGVHCDVVSIERVLSMLSDGE